VIVAIGGRALSQARRTPDELLVNAADRDVALTIVARHERTARRRARAARRAHAALSRVGRCNRALVHERTGGRVGYVHIPDMGPWGFSEFHRGYLSEFNRDG
jgi:tricorn protease